MPRLIFQRTGKYALRHGTPGFFDGEFHPCHELPSLFSEARTGGYRTYLIGWYHPYARMLGDSVDVVRSVCRRHWLGETAVARGRAFFWEAALHVFGVRAGRQFKTGLHCLANRGMVYATHSIADATRAVLEDPASGQFALFHWPVPHMPLCFAADGPQPLDDYYRIRSARLKRRQLEYTDALLGEMVDTLRRQGKFDNSTIILTSDHTWTFDPRLKKRSSFHDRTHVPLFIKFPGQRRRINLTAKFSNVRLGELLRISRGVNHDLDQIADVVADGRFHFEPKQDKVIRAADSRRHLLIINH